MKLKSNSKRHPLKGLWNCLGACNQGGTAIQRVMLSRGVGFRHAVEILKDGRALVVTGEVKLKSRATIPVLETPLSGGAEEAELLEQVTSFYQRTFSEQPLQMDILGKGEPREFC